MTRRACDALGRRIAKTVNGVSTRLVYDQEDILVEYDEVGVPQARYTHGPGIDEPVSRRTASAGAGLGGLRVLLASTPDGTRGPVVANLLMVNGHQFFGFQTGAGPQPAVGAPIDSTGSHLPLAPLDITGLITGDRLTVELRVDFGRGGSAALFAVIVDPQTGEVVRSQQLLAPVATFFNLSGFPTIYASTTVSVGTLVAPQTVFYHADALGSITELTDGTGAVVQRYSYEAFGAILASPGTVAQPYTFTGREFDPETGLYYYRARAYDPDTGRFLQEDPIGFAGGLHLYAYVGNNPVNLVDPTGKLSSCVCGGFSGYAAIGIGLCWGTAKCRCPSKCGTAEWVTVNYICSCVPAIGASVGGGPSFGGDRPRTDVVEGPALSVPLSRRRNIGAGVSPGPGRVSIDIGRGAFAGSCACAVDVVE